MMMMMCAYRSDPILKHGHGTSSSSCGQQQQQLQQLGAERQVDSDLPPSDGHSVRAPGTGLVRDGSIKSLVSCYENKVHEVRRSFHIYNAVHKNFRHIFAR